MRSGSVRLPWSCQVEEEEELGDWVIERLGEEERASEDKANDEIRDFLIACPMAPPAPKMARVSRTLERVMS